MATLEARRIRTRIVTVTIGYQCNQCGKKAVWDDDKVSHDESQNFHTFSAGGGYYTTFPGDTDSVEFALCSDCLKALCDGFAVPANHVVGLGGQFAPIAVVREDTGAPATINCYWLVDGNVDKVPLTAPPAEHDEYDWPDYNPTSQLVYRHYKGNYYEVLACVLHYETGEPFVIYSTLYGEPRLWARRLASWNETIVDPVTQHAIRRFEPVRLDAIP